MRCAYIELNYGHGEIQPTFWWLGRETGIEIDFFVLRENAELEPLCMVPGPVSMTPIDASDPHDPCSTPLDVEDRWDPQRYDFLILGTAEPIDRIEKLASIDLPKLHVVHNIDAYASDDPLATPCVLARHGLESLAREDAIAVEPFYCGEIAACDKPRSNVICVPGNVQLERRNYGSLLRGLEAVAADGATPSDVSVRLVGRSTVAGVRFPDHFRTDGDLVRERLEARGLSEFVELADREYGFSELYERIATSRYVLPLIDDFYAHSVRYMHSKNSGAIGCGIGWLNIPIINRRYASRLGIDFGQLVRTRRRGRSAETGDGRGRWSHARSGCRVPTT